ncbi:MauE/DoxX family redox-associated membrane protein [Streptosporangium sp. NPDC051022]|uniref:MauE/DoxX family redox-associated membrane protein n=1 Tax=Streptosporangium sp. NPDC051022 TaxID=3155752 RepID=UPI00344453AA
MNYLLTSVRFLIGLIFLVSFVSKIAGRQRFMAFNSSLRDMGILPLPVVRPVAFMVLAAEGSVWGLLAIPTLESGVSAGLILATLLLIIFMTGIAITKYRGKSATCPCFGISDASLGLRHIARNGVLALVSLAGISASLMELDDTSGWKFMLAALAGLLLGTLVIMFDEIIELFLPAAD